LSNSIRPTKHILLVDPDEAFGQVLQEVLGPDNLLRRVSRESIGQLDFREVDVVLLNLDLPEGDVGSKAECRSKINGKSKSDETKVQDTRALLTSVAEAYDPAPVIAFGWDSRRERAVEAIRHGAVDFLEQPLDIQALKFALDAAHRRATLARDLAAAQSLIPVHVEGLLGNSAAMEQVNDIVQKVSGVQTSVLITGESGTGKGVVARAIHNLSQRKGKPFVAFSACAFPESLIEDELFGHEKGAFTGASQMRRGRFEEAKGGTIFLDEIGDLALPLQAKLLRVLQERSLERLGSNAAQPIDVRVICATSRNLEKMVQEGTFREDLYFRISVVRVHMPPLRERGEDIPLLAEYFLRTFAKMHNKAARSLTPGFLSALARHNWPGNVRELQNVIERSLVLANGNEHLGVRDLPSELRGFTISDEIESGSFHKAVQSFKRELVRSALRMHSGNKLKAAKELGISRCYLHRLLNQLKISDGSPEELVEMPARRQAAAASVGAEPFALSSRAI
jgi:two-component system, NtrC family, response regulator HydG